jgi:hypothetical protein
MQATRALSWQEHLQRSARRLGAALWAGLIGGAVVGGIGGRLAMFVLRLTSDPTLHGLETDDGFVIGEFTGDTAFLVLFTAALGALGGIFYLTIRSWLPKRVRVGAFTLLAAVVGGSLVIRPDGIDFTLLEPLWFAVALFVALPALYGLMMSSFAERLLSEREGGPRFSGWLPSLAPLLGLAIGGPAGLMLLVLAALGWILNLKLPLAEIWTSRGVAWIGRTALLSVGALALATLTADIAEIL